MSLIEASDHLNPNTVDLIRLSIRGTSVRKGLESYEINEMELNQLKFEGELPIDSK